MFAILTLFFGWIGRECLEGSSGDKPKALSFSIRRPREGCQQETAREGARDREHEPEEQGARRQDKAGGHGSAVVALQSQIQRVSRERAQEQHSAADGARHGPSP